MFGLPLTTAETETFRSVTGGRSVLTEQAREVFAICGRRSGKSSVAAIIAAWMAATFLPKGAKLRPGERAVVACLAVDREQANVVRKMISGLFAEVPALNALVIREIRDGLELSNSVDIIVVTSSFRAVRGRSYLCAIFDECAFWRDEEGGPANPDREIYRGLKPGLATIPGSILIGISSPHKRSGLCYEKWKNHFGKDDDRILVVHAPTPVFNANPAVLEEIEAARREDPILARSDYDAEWRDDLTGFIDRALLEAAIDPVAFRPYRSRYDYKLFFDAAEGVSASGGDSFAASIAHAEGDIAVQDWLYERRPPFNVSEVVREIATVAKTYRIREAMGDNHALGFTIQELAKHSIKVVDPCPLTKSDLYRDLLSRFSGHAVRLVNNERQTSQFANLERKVVSGASDRFDHSRNGHDDAANACAGALWRAVSKKTLTASDYRRVNSSPRMRGAPWRSNTGITDVAIAARSFPSTDSYAQAGGDRG
jgi:hypothetical protein